MTIIYCESCEKPVADDSCHLTSDGAWLCSDCYRQACEEHCREEGAPPSEYDDYMEDDQGRPINDKGETWIECDKCHGEGAYDTFESDASDWGEDCCSDAPDTIYTCSECGGEGGRWIKFREEA